jgi:hypothetical protein
MSYQRINTEEEYHGVTLHRITNDTNGNGRYVVHYPELLPRGQRNGFTFLDASGNIWPTPYDAALFNSRKLGGRKYTAKWYGGGIVFQSADPAQLAKAIKELREANA